MMDTRHHLIWAADGWSHYLLLSTLLFTVYWAASGRQQVQGREYHSISLLSSSPSPPLSQISSRAHQQPVEFTTTTRSLLRLPLMSLMSLMSCCHCHQAFRFNFLVSFWFDLVNVNIVILYIYLTPDCKTISFLGISIENILWKSNTTALYYITVYIMGG